MRNKTIKLTSIIIFIILCISVLIVGQNAYKISYSNCASNFESNNQLVAGQCNQLNCVENATTCANSIYNYDKVNLNSIVSSELSKREDIELAYTSSDDDYVYLGGTPMGIIINAGGLIVLETVGVRTNRGEIFPAKGKVRKGEIITHINDKKIDNLYLFKDIIEKSSSDVYLTILSKGQSRVECITPAIDELTSKKRVGIMSKEDIGGVGTLTFVTKSGKFAGLGHRITDSESGLSFELNKGSLVNTNIDEVIKGQKGKAGGLLASVNKLKKPFASIEDHISIGIYGDYKSTPTSRLMKIAKFGEARMGSAKVYTTIEGDSPKFYDIDIVKVVSQHGREEKGLVISVSDKALLAKTGGIVQGMSGSPIIQNNMIIGAVTHVFISDPTKGYGVHSRFMLDACKSLEQEQGIKKSNYQNVLEQGTFEMLEKVA